MIPTWNGRGLLERCLATVVGQVGVERTIVVDNGSTDATVEMLGDRFPQTDVVALPRNVGFATAVNAGIARSAADHVVLVNNDVECDPGFVAAMVNCLERDPAVGMVAGVLVTPDRERVDSYGVEVDRTLSAFARYTGARWPMALDDRHLALPSGGAAAYRRGALDAVGGFDERLFAYMEDVDLGLRLVQAGWRCAGAPTAIGLHLGSATFGRRSRWQVEVSGFARGYVVRKYRVLRRGPVIAAWTLLVEAGVVAADLLTGGDLAAARGRWRGWRAARGQHAPIPDAALNRRIGLRDALRRRRAAVASCPPRGSSGASKRPRSRRPS